MQALKTADHDAKELQEMPAATINKLNRDTTERSPTNTRPAYHKALRIAVTTVEENILHQIVDFINWSAGFPRRQVTLKKSAVISSSRRRPGDILDKLTICLLRIPLRVMSRRPQKNTLCTIFGAVICPQWSH